MSHASFIYLFAIVVGYKVVSACILTPLNPAPLFAQNLGSKKVIFKPQKSEIDLDIGESITAYCSSGVIYKKYDDRYGYNTNQALSSNTVEFNCDSDNKISIKGIISAFTTQITVQCKSITNYDIYESEMDLPNCENYVTYAIGAPIQMVGSDIKAGICYDLDNLKLKFVSYIAQSNSEAFIFDEATFNATRDKLRKIQTLFDAFEFDFTSLLQEESLKSELESHEYIFNTIWWRQLRQHNWRYFLDALRERTQSVKYFMHLGTYGNMTVPPGNCDLFKKEIVAIHQNNKAITAPAYIWAYLKTPPSEDGQKKEDIVVIAYNSPYALNPTHEEFCEFDICDEVEWLKNSTFGNLRRLATLGYMFCCRPEDVALIIDYFPMQQNKHEITLSGEVESNQSMANVSHLASSHAN